MQWRKLISSILTEHLKRGPYVDKKLVHQWEKSIKVYMLNLSRAQRALGSSDRRPQRPWLMQKKQINDWFLQKKSNHWSGFRFISCLLFIKRKIQLVMKNPYAQIFMLLPKHNPGNIPFDCTLKHMKNPYAQIFVIMLMYSVLFLKHNPGNIPLGSKAVSRRKP